MSMYIYHGHFVGSHAKYTKRSLRQLYRVTTRWTGDKIDSLSMVHVLMTNVDLNITTTCS